jgi:hypothetical protein
VEDLLQYLVDLLRWCRVTGNIIGVEWNTIFRQVKAEISLCLPHGNFFRSVNVSMMVGYHLNDSLAYRWGKRGREYVILISHSNSQACFENIPRIVQNSIASFIWPSLRILISRKAAFEIKQVRRVFGSELFTNKRPELVFLQNFILADSGL